MSIKKKFRFYNFIMIIIPIVVTLFVFRVSTKFFEQQYLIRDDSYLEYINKSSGLIKYVKESKEFDYRVLVNKTDDLNFSMYIMRNGELFFENFSRIDESLIPSINVIEENVVYHFGGKIMITAKAEYDDGIYDFYFLTRDYVSPVVSTTVVQALLLSVLVISFVTVGLTNYITTNSMIKMMLKPLENMTKSANEIRKGNLSKPLGKAGINELERFFMTFDLMRINLKNNIAINAKYEKDRREMLAGISHDLKTPITVVKGYSKGIIDGVAKEDEQVRRYIETIYRKSLEMESLLNQLTVFSKLENNSFASKLENKNLHGILELFIEQHNSTIYNKNLKIEYINRCKKVDVNIDVLQMQRVFDNIISNSLKYNNKANVRVKVLVRMISSKEVSISISDNGIGVPEKDLDKIFESFYRVDKARSSKVEGNGLGLAICKGIVEAHNGKIYAKSGYGLTIVINLPVGE